MFDLIVEFKDLSKTNLKQGIRQDKMSPSDIVKTALNTNNGHFEDLSMPMAATNPPATFQTLMNRFFPNYVDEFCMVYIHDLSVISEDKKSHHQHLKKVLWRF